MLLETSGASLLGNLLSGKGIVRAGYGNKKGKEIVRLLVMEMKWVVNAPSSFNELWNTKVLLK